MQNDYFSIPRDLYEDIHQNPGAYLSYYDYHGRQCAKHVDASEKSISLKIDKKVSEDVKRSFENILAAKRLQGNLGGAGLQEYIASHLHNTFLLKFDIVKCFNSISFDLFENAASHKLQNMSLIKSFYFRPNLLVGLAASAVIAEVVLIKVIDNFLNTLLNSAEFKGKGVEYTRYYDDIYLSSQDELLLADLQARLTKRLMDNGFQISKKKSSLSKMENSTILKNRINNGRVSVGRRFKNNLRRQIYIHNPDASDLQSIGKTISELNGLIGKISHILRTETSPSQKWYDLQNDYIHDLEEFQAMRDQLLMENIGSQF